MSIRVDMNYRQRQMTERWPIPDDPILSFMPHGTGVACCQDMFVVRATRSLGIYRNNPPCPDPCEAQKLISYIN